MATWYKAGTTNCFNVESRVGLGLRASRIDTKLAQFLLTKATRLARRWGRMRESYAPMQDGIFGAGTFRALRAFQQSSRLLVADGVVSPMRGGSSGWDESHKWTIGSLQYCYAALDLGAPADTEIPPFATTEAIKRMPFDPEADGELRMHLAALLMSV